MNTLLLSLVVLIMCDETDAILHKDSIKKFVFSKGRNHSYTIENPESEEDLAFPGYNREILLKIYQLWQNYYSCLEKQVNRTLKPEMHRIVEGQFIE